MKNGWQFYIFVSDSVMGQGKLQLLTGRVSKELMLDAEEFPADARNRAIKMFSKFFMVPSTYCMHL